MTTILTDAKWTNNRQKTIADIQPGGSGYSPEFVGVQHNVGALGGGGVSVERRFGQSVEGETTYLGKNITSDPQPFTGDISLSMSKQASRLIKRMQPYLIRQALPGSVNLRVREGESIKVDYISSYDAMRIYVDAVITSQTPSDNLKRGPTPDTAGDGFLMENISIDAAFMLDIYKQAHNQVVGVAGNYGLNKIIKSGVADVFIVSDQDSGPVAKIIHSPDLGETWTVYSINTLTGASENANDIVEFQNLLLVASDAVGVTYAETQDIIDGVSTPWTDATLDAITWATTFPNGLVQLLGKKVICFGDGGFLAEATSGQSFTTANASTVVTSDDLTVGVVADDETAFFGGTNTTNLTVVKYKAGSYSAITVVASNTDTITALAVPPGRSNWLFVGTDAGQIYVCKDTTRSVPVFTLLDIPDTGTGSIDGIEFDSTGALMYYIHTISSASVIKRDLSGGAGGANVESITSPASVVMNSMAVIDFETVLVVGEALSSAGYVGRVAP